MIWENIEEKKINNSPHCFASSNKMEIVSVVDKWKLDSGNSSIHYNVVSASFPLSFFLFLLIWLKRKFSLTLTEQREHISLSWSAVIFNRQNKLKTIDDFNLEYVYLVCQRDTQSINFFF